MAFSFCLYIFYVSVYLGRYCKFTPDNQLLLLVIQPCGFTLCVVEYSSHMIRLSSVFSQES